MQIARSLPELTDRATTLADTATAPARALIGIAGAPGAGKSTVAERLLVSLADRGPEGWVGHVPMDGYHLADAQLDRLGLRDRKGAPETFDAAGYAALLARVAAGGDEPIYVPGFERDLEQPIAAALVVHPEARLVLTEGNYLLLDEGAWPRARAQLTQTWYVDVDPALRLDRLIARHVEFGKTPAEAAAWVHRLDEANAAKVAETKSRADLVIILD